MFQVLTTEQLFKYFKEYNWQRKPKELHWHHTWIPNHSHFKGNNHLQLQQSMKNSHINERGWSDIGQHLTIFPDGIWATGRNFNRDPASIKNRNHLGFAVEILGDFDIGKDKLEGKQLEAAINFGAFFIDFFNLTIKNNVFHREYDKSKSCPGSGLNKNWFVGLIRDKLIKMEVSKLVTDFDDHWAKNDIEYCMEKGIFVKTDRFRPQDNITRAEVATVVARLLRLLGK